MDWVEVTGKTVDEARNKAVDLLGIAEEDADVEVLAEPKMGLFGRLREEARVRARVRPATPRSKDDSARKGRGRGRAPKETTPVETAPATSTPAPVAATPAAAPARAPQQRGRARAAAASEEPRMESAMYEDRAQVPVADQAAVAKEFVDGLLTIMGLDEASSTVVLIAEDTAELQISGGDLGLLIGPKGATLLALQDLARTVVQRRTGARTGRLLLDVSGYRQKRKEALERFTQKVAADVLASGSPTALEPMSSADRKIVHDTVNAIDGVATTSEGEDPRRHVVVRPG